MTSHSIVSGAASDPLSETFGAAAEEIVHLILSLRPRHSWVRIAETMAEHGHVRPNGKPWSNFTLQGCCTRLVRRGHLPKTITGPTRKRADAPDLLGTVAGVVKAHPKTKPTLAEVGEALTAAGIRSPRGNAHWSPSTVAALLYRARARRLLATEA